MNKCELIARFIKANPGSTTSVIYKSLNMPATTTYANIRKIERLNILDTVKQGNKVKYSIAPDIDLDDVFRKPAISNIEMEIRNARKKAEELIKRKLPRRAATTLEGVLHLLYSDCDKRQIIELKNKYWRMAERPRHGGAA